MKWPESIPITQVALAFITGLMVLVSLIGAFSAYQTRTVTHELEQHVHEAAKSELDMAIERVVRQTETQADKLSRWGETRQQLILPEYYTYWRDQRVYESGILHNQLAHTALYDKSGKRLASGTAESHFPDLLTSDILTRQPSNWLVNEAGTTVLYQLFPVYSSEGQMALLGHGLIRLDFMSELLRQEGFHSVDIKRVKITLAPGEIVTPSDLGARLRYNVLSSHGQAQFKSILSNTLLALFIVLLTAALLAYTTYSRLLVKPLRQLSQDIDAMQHGQFDQAPSRSVPMRVTELENIRRSLHDYQLQLRELHGSLEHQNRIFHSQARQDALTGCHNRRAYEEDWEHFRQELANAPQGVAFLLFDCDRFKTINDTYGHTKGDRVLCIIVDALVMALRANDRLYRLGGDEFATFMPHTSPAQARQIAQRCQSLIDAANFKDLGINEPIGISIGIAYCEADQCISVDELPKQADVAMYTAKQPGRNRIALFGEDMDRATQTLVASRETSALFQALANPSMIEMHYQPIYVLPERQLDYYEALARIRHRDELLMPGTFLPVVSNRRLETEFDMAVLHQIESDLSSGQLPPGCGISINLSAQSLSRSDVISHLLELSRHNERHPLMLEITETSLITQMSEVSGYLEMLRSVNYRIAMDDFGTGYSPLRYLADLPVDVVKFDISLVNKLDQDNRAGRVVADFARMMSEVGYSLVAEGVETESVLRKVESLGIDHVQGYLLGRPMPLAQLAAFHSLPVEGKTARKSA
ncbi:MAG: EAL domain-containing protein [Rhodocyclaceae bacterium]|jgi:diguanylate cyclase (GGDEF)-like protein|nr:EAL domain-containing protein [Rhodocyclaceae bacterium]